MKRRYTSPKSLWPQKDEKIIKLSEPVLKEESEELLVLKPTLKDNLIVTNETRLFWTLGLISVAILIVITLSLLLATIQNARLLTILISKK